MVFGHADPVAVAAVLAVALGVHLFAVFYEEPTLHKKFGADYDEYCRNVSRWWPRLRGLGQATIAEELAGSRFEEIRLRAAAGNATCPRGRLPGSQGFHFYE